MAYSNSGSTIVTLPWRTLIINLWHTVTLGVLQWLCPEGLRLSIHDKQWLWKYYSDSVLRDLDYQFMTYSDSRITTVILSWRTLIMNLWHTVTLEVPQWLCPEGLWLSVYDIQWLWKYHSDSVLRDFDYQFMTYSDSGITTVTLAWRTLIINLWHTVTLELLQWLCPEGLWLSIYDIQWLWKYYSDSVLRDFDYQLMAYSNSESTTVSVLREFDYQLMAFSDFVLRDFDYQVMAYSNFGSTTVTLSWGTLIINYGKL